MILFLCALPTRAAHFFGKASKIHSLVTHFLWGWIDIPAEICYNLVTLQKMEKMSL